MSRAARPALICVVLILGAGVGSADEFPGIAVDPPGSESWVQVQRNAASLVWMRRTGIPTLSFGAALLTQRLDRRFASHDAFVEWVRASKEANPDPRRFRLVESRVASAGTGRETCARYRTVVEDTSAGQAAETVLRLEVVGLACLHPDQPARYYDIQYSARMPAGDSLPAGLTGEGAAFVDSASFRPAPADEDWSLGDRVPAPVRREAT